METVYQAEAYRWEGMQSYGNANYMLIRQHQFPHEFNPRKDKMLSKNDDRIWDQERDHAKRCFAEHKTEEIELQTWFRTIDPNRILEFLKDFLKADSDVTWTGFRILGTVTMRGYPVWTIQLFAKHPTSRTRVFDTENAPHLIKGSRKH